jgi:hypothetical protein
MQARTQRVALFFAVSGFAAAAAIFACSTDNGPSTINTLDARSESSSGGEDAPIEPGPDACADAFVPRQSAGPRCLGVVDAGGDGATFSKNCAGKTQICCSDGRFSDGGFAGSDCLNATVTGNSFQEGQCAPTFQGDGGKEWHCTEAAHCPGTGSVCCMIGSTEGNPIPSGNNDWPGCETTKFQNSRFIGGTRCRATCNAGELQLCSSSAECKAGNCIFLEAENRNIGYCRVQ